MSMSLLFIIYRFKPATEGDQNILNTYRQADEHILTPRIRVFLAMQ